MRPGAAPLAAFPLAPCRWSAPKSSTCCCRSSSSYWTGEPRFASWRSAVTPAGQCGRSGALPRGGSPKTLRLSFKALACACRALSGRTRSRCGPAGTSTRSGQAVSARRPSWPAPSAGARRCRCGAGSIASATSEARARLKRCEDSTCSSSTRSGERSSSSTSACCEKAAPASSTRPKSIARATFVAACKWIARKRKTRRPSRPASPLCSAATTSQWPFARGGLGLESGELELASLAADCRETAAAGPGKRRRRVGKERGGGGGDEKRSSCGLARAGAACFRARSSGPSRFHRLRCACWA